MFDLDTLGPFSLAAGALVAVIAVWILAHSLNKREMNRGAESMVYADHVTSLIPRPAVVKAPELSDEQVSFVKTLHPLMEQKVAPEEIVHKMKEFLDNPPSPEPSDPTP